MGGAGVAGTTDMLYAAEEADLAVAVAVAALEIVGCSEEKTGPEWEWAEQSRSDYLQGRWGCYLVVGGAELS